MTPIKAPLLRILAGLAFLLGAAVPAAAQDIDVQNTPVLLQADELIYNEDLGIVTARGNVEMSQGPRLLMADTVTYNQNANTVTASGNVSLMEPSGEVIFTNYAELHDELKTGFIENLRALLVDGSRLAANRARRTAEGRKIMDRGVFSPCNLCKEDPQRAPLWQLKAVRVIHDEVAKDIIYHDATMELYGVPILYTPYLAHPDPTVERRSGLLAPTLGVSGDLGVIYGQPYYYTFNPSQDMTVEPMIFTSEGGVVRGEYRQRFSNGRIDLKGTTGYVDQYDDTDNATGSRGVEASADMEGLFALNRTWRGGFDFEQTSDRTYLKRFRLGHEDVLTSRLYTEGFRGRTYAAVNAYKWQDLRASSDPDDTPLVAPFAEYSFVGEPMRIGGRQTLDANLLALSRQRGTDSRRASLVHGWQLPHTTSSGQMFTVESRLQSDGYYASDLESQADDAETTARMFPQVGVKWQYPWARRAGSYSHVIEPIIGVVGSPNGGNPDEIPNEDSRSFEFDTTNLFRLNRYEGVDRVTSGSRVDYALRTGVYGDGGGSTDVLIGQSYRFYGDSAFEEGTGLSEEVSDIVGAITVRPREEFDLSYRFRLDKETGTIRRNEIGFGYYHPRFALLADYIAIDDSASTDLAEDREQIEATLSVNLSPNWNTSMNAIYDLSEGDGELLRGRIGVTYTDECLLFGVDFERSDIEDVGIEADTRLMFRIVFKYLGGIESR